jgi:hypothetical protein
VSWDRGNGSPSSVFGTKTSRTFVIFGRIVRLTGLFLSDSVSLLSQVLSKSVLRVILFCPFFL